MNTDRLLILTLLMQLAVVQCPVSQPAKSDVFDATIDSILTATLARQSLVDATSSDSLSCQDRLTSSANKMAYSNTIQRLELLKLLFSSHSMVDSQKQAFFDQLNCIKNMMPVEIHRVVSYYTMEESVSDLITAGIMDEVVMPTVTFLAINRAKSYDMKLESLCVILRTVVEQMQSDSRTLRESGKLLSTEELKNENWNTAEDIESIADISARLLRQKCSDISN